MEKKQTAEGVLFVLEKPFDGRGQWLFAWYAFSFVLPALFLLFMAGEMWIGGGVEVLVLVAAALASLVIGFRYLTGAWRKDTLLITPDTVLLSQQKGFHKTQQSFSRAAITGLRFLDKPEETPHPLAGKTFDYLGFQTQQQVISEIFADHRVAFDYQGRTISFGRKIYSWDFAEIRDALLGHPDEPEAELPWNEPPAWDTYWRSFAAFTASVPRTQSYIVQAAEDTRLSVDGTTDGWYDHQQALKALLVRYEDQLTISQQTQLKELIAFVQDVIGRS